MVYIKIFQRFNPFNPHDALKHHFASLKNDLNSKKLGILEQFFLWCWSIITLVFFHLSPTSSHLHSLQVENCDSNSRLVVDEDNYGKFMLERVKGQYASVMFR